MPVAKPSYPYTEPNWRIGNKAGQRYAYKRLLALVRRRANKLRKRAAYLKVTAPASMITIHLINERANELDRLAEAISIIVEAIS